MFKKYPNHEEINKLIKTLEPVFFFKSYTEKNTYENDKNYGEVIYKTSTNDGWSCSIIFCNKVNKPIETKQYNPEILFTKIENELSDSHFKKLKKKTKQLAEHFQEIYKPDYKRLFHIINLFINNGINAGMCNKIEMTNYKEHLKSHIKCNHVKNSLEFNLKNLAIVYFNPLIQKNSIDKNGYLKKSYITLSLIYLISSDNTLKPYFKIRLPYCENNHGTCILSLTGEFKAYFPNSDSDYMNNFIDELKDMAVDDDSFNSIIKNNFLKEVKNIISNTLNINKKELENLTFTELKDYFTMVEMIKL